MEQAVLSPVEIGQGISTYGFMVMTCSFFLIAAFTGIITLIRQNFRLMNNLIETQRQSVEKMLERQQSNSRMLEEIRDNIRRPNEQKQSVSPVGSDHSDNEYYTGGKY